VPLLAQDETTRLTSDTTKGVRQARVPSRPHPGGMARSGAWVSASA